MTMAFDLISDLHLDTWPTPFDFTGQATSPYCIIAGDVCSNRSKLIEFLEHIGTCYRAVFYIDGNEEHKNYMEDLALSYRDLAHRMRRIPNVVFVQDNVVIIDGVAILGTNGWWNYEFDYGINAHDVRSWLRDKENYSDDTVQQIKACANTDARYLMASVKRLQTHRDITNIVVVTHTVPRPDLIEHDPDLAGTFKFNCMGNRLLQAALDMDTEHKIHTWCFGHYHGKVDQVKDGIRWVNHCRGRANTTWSQWAYYPLRIEIGN